MTIPHESPLLRERVRCYDCYRPRDQCFCDRIPTITNRTEIILLQHMRERFHAFNTARIVRKSLQHSRLMVDHLPALATAFDSLALSPRAGILYPGTEATLLSDLPPSERPDQLIIIDGTWHHAKSMLRDIAPLRQLRRFGLEPTAPSNYRIRREPKASFLSTLEATVAALRMLEPELAGLDDLVAAFDAMVDQQLAVAKPQRAWRRKQRQRTTPTLTVPDVLARAESLVVVYIEAAPGLHHGQGKRTQPSRSPLYWSAIRLGSNERFEHAVIPSLELTESLLHHLDLPHAAFDHALTLEQLAVQWQQFLMPADTVVSYHSHVRMLLDQFTATSQPRVYLREMQLERNRKNGTLEQLLKRHQIHAGNPLGQGRASKRLAATVSLVQWLSDRAREPPIA